MKNLIDCINNVNEQKFAYKAAASEAAQVFLNNLDTVDNYVEYILSFLMEVTDNGENQDLLKRFDNEIYYIKMKKGYKF